MLSVENPTDSIARSDGISGNYLTVVAQVWNLSFGVCDRRIRPSVAGHMRQSSKPTTVRHLADGGTCNRMIRGESQFFVNYILIKAKNFIITVIANPPVGYNRQPKR